MSNLLRLFEKPPRAGWQRRVETRAPPWLHHPCVKSYTLYTVLLNEQSSTDKGIPGIPHDAFKSVSKTIAPHIYISFIRNSWMHFLILLLDKANHWLDLKYGLPPRLEIPFLIGPSEFTSPMKRFNWLFWNKASPFNQSPLRDANIFIKSCIDTSHKPDWGNS